MDEKLSRRERQLLAVLYREKEATVAEVRAELDDPPSYDGVRTTLRVLEKKGYVRHRQDGPRYLYAPTVPVENARASALRRLVSTFFGGSSAQAALALLAMSEDDLSQEEIGRLRELVAEEEGER